MGIRNNSPETACQIITACVVLHNFATAQHDFIDPEYLRELDDNDNDPEAIDFIDNQTEMQALNAGKMYRNVVANRLYSVRN